MVSELIALYKALTYVFYSGQATDEECELLQEISLILQSKGVSIV